MGLVNVPIAAERFQTSPRLVLLRKTHEDNHSQESSKQSEFFANGQNRTTGGPEEHETLARNKWLIFWIYALLFGRAVWRRNICGH